jgi:hypothetical protein
MIGSISGGEGLGNASSLYVLRGSQPVVGSSAPLSPVGLSGAEPLQTSASISGAGQLLSNLEQLQTQDPTQFTQVVSQIASQLQTAAQQAQGTQSEFLSNLAAQFQSVANGGSLSQLQPQQGQQAQQGDQIEHHHHHHAQQAYSQNTQGQSQGVASLAQTSATQSSGSATLQQLFATISSEVSQALAG